MSNPARISEAQLQDAIIDTAHTLGYIVAHFRPARTEKGWRTPVAADGRGFPDLVLVSERYGRVLFVECKSEDGELSRHQQWWLEMLRAAGAEVYVWRPEDWTTGAVERALRGAGR